MRRRLAYALLAAAIFAAPAHAQAKVTLMPGVTYEPGVQFTTHGPVAFHVLIAPKPDGSLYQIKPILSNEAILGRETVTSMQKRHATSASVAGVNGDLFNWRDGHPTGALMRGGVLEHPPFGDRSSVGIDSSGNLHVDRVKFYGTWRGTGQRRTLSGLNEAAGPNEVALYTPVYGPTTPAVTGSVEEVLSPFPQTVPNTDLTSTVVEVRQGGKTPIPVGGAVLVGRGSAAQVLTNEAPVGTTIPIRLILQPDWTGMVDALGGGPVLVRDGKPVFRALEAFSPDQLQPRGARTAIGQLADGRYIFLAIDGRQPGYSVGMTNFEVAQTMVRLGAVAASALDSGGSTTMAFDGTLLNKPSDARGERQVAESIDVFYYGVNAPPPTPDVFSPNGDGVDETVALAYKVVRPSTVTASLTGPGGITIPLDAVPGEVRQPATYPFTWNGLDAAGSPLPEGRWTWTVTATDDTGRQTTTTRTFLLNRTLAALSVSPPLMRLPAHGARLTATFTLSAPASVALRIETLGGTVIRTILEPSLAAGSQTISWNGLLLRGTPVHSGRYVARVLATNTMGTVKLAKPFVVRRIVGK